MESFSAEWLSLREPADHAARSRPLTAEAIEALPLGGPLRILDLAAGTGSNFRYLTAAGLGKTGRAEFLLVDHDPTLLATVTTTSKVATRCLDLAALGDQSIFDGRVLVTASALLDLVSESWLRALALRCAESRAGVLFALTYDGRIACTPEDREDRAMVERVNEHQRRGKGFGPALGPDASGCAARCFSENGYRVAHARSDWRLTPETAELQRQLVDGWARAAAEVAPFESVAIEAWCRRRQQHIDAGRSYIVVGHQDVWGKFGSKDLRI